ncbi:MAG: amidohydrolase family protein [candidate division Zixibacteria bacterium]|nr:amidohydrolase family protein [candidate division Zixibacteria bacterium]
MTNVSDIGVIDIHVHVQPWHMMHPHILALMKRGRENWDTLDNVMNDPGVLLRTMDDAGIDTVGVINYVAPQLMGFTFECNRFAYEYVKNHRDRLFAHGSIDPVGSTDPDGEITQILDEWGMRAVKVHPPHQGVAPNAYLDGNTILPKLYDACQTRGVPVVFHTGTTIFKGARIKYGDPIHLDDVACDFPDLKIILAHSGRPLWVPTARFLARRHPNVYLDLSGIPPHRIPEYFPDIERFAGKLMWGTDWPGPGVPSMDGNLTAFVKQGHDEYVLRRVLRENAVRVFGL